MPPRGAVAAHTQPIPVTAGGSRGTSGLFPAWCCRLGLARLLLRQCEKGDPTTTCTPRSGPTARESRCRKAVIRFIPSLYRRATMFKVWFTSNKGTWPLVSQCSCHQLVFFRSHVSVTRTLQDLASWDHHPSPQHAGRSKGAIEHSPGQVPLPPACSGKGKSKPRGGFRALLRLSYREHQLSLAGTAKPRSMVQFL